jgi:cation:H+ antiporter
MLHVGLLALAFAALVFGAQYFTNAIEWLGHRLHLGDSATGSFLAAIGTATPETLVSLVAIFFASGADSRSVGIGGILGAPFMLSTLAMLVVALALLGFRKRRQTTKLQFNPETAASDLQFFLLAYGLAIIAALLPPDVRLPRLLIAFFLIPLYVFYMLRLLRASVGQASNDVELGPLQVISHFPEHILPFENWAKNPGLGSISVQLLLGLGLIIGGAELFVGEIQTLATAVGVRPLLLSLLITPVATELPETLNSVLWISRKRDTLAFGNISGALVFQSAFPVTIGILATDWTLSLTPGSETFFGALSSVLAIASGAFLLFFIKRYQALYVPHLLAGGVLYVLFVGALIFGALNGMIAAA